MGSGGVVWGGAGICARERVSGRGIAGDARGAVFCVVSVVIRVLSCGF